MLIFAFFILWKTTDQRLEEFGMLASETGGELVRWWSCVPVFVGAFFLRAWQKCQHWGSHTLLFLCVYGLSSLSQCMKYFWSLSTKGFKNPDRVCNFPMLAITFCDFLPLSVCKGCVFFWPHTVVTMYSCSSVFTVFAVGKASLFNILFQISRPGFSMWELISFKLQDCSLQI